MHECMLYHLLGDMRITIRTLHHAYIEPVASQNIHLKGGTIKSNTHVVKLYYITKFSV